MNRPLDNVNTSHYLRVIKALADETRLRIINLLFERELCVCDLCEILGTSQTKISRHLSYLKNAGLVQDSRIAQWSFYSLIRSRATSIVNDIVRGILRNIDLYRGDLEHLKEKEKAGACKSNVAVKIR